MSTNPDKKTFIHLACLYESFFHKRKRNACREKNFVSFPLKVLFFYTAQIC